MANILNVKYNVLTQLKSNIISNIKSVQIFGTNGKEVVFNTNDNKVYAFGDNINGCLGFGHKNPLSEPQIVSELNGQELIKIDGNSNGFVVGLTQSKQIYVWGYNCNYDTNYGRNRTTYGRPTLTNTLQSIPAIDISCSSDYTHVLTPMGELYRMSNTPNSKKVFNFKKLNELNGEKVTTISSGYQHSLALTRSGEVLAFGQNSYGQLGLGDSDPSDRFEKIDSIEEVVIKIICGQNYSLVLTNEGQIYGFGDNALCQLGVGDKTNRNKPTLIVNSIKFIDIFADSLNNISMAMSEDKVVYVWGDCKTGVIDCPQRSALTTFQESIIKFCKNVFTYGLVSKYEAFICQKPLHRLSSVMANAFNKPEESDLWFRFTVNKKNKYIFGHKFFIKANSEYFKTMFSNDWKECQQIDGHNEVEIKGHTYDSYYAFIQFLYTDLIETQDMKILIELLDIGNEYMETELKCKCTQVIKILITIGNVCDVYSASVEYKCNELENYCFNFMINDMKNIIKTESYKRMDSVYVKHFTTKHIEYLSSKSIN